MAVNLNTKENYSNLTGQRCTIDRVISCLSDLDCQQRLDKNWLGWSSQNECCCEVDVSKNSVSIVQVKTQKGSRTKVLAALTVQLKLHDDEGKSYTMYSH